MPADNRDIYSRNCSIVDIHAGALSIDSTPGEGTTVTVELPAME